MFWILVDAQAGYNEWWPSRKDIARTPGSITSGTPLRFVCTTG
jgi:hypothetical protein